MGELARKESTGSWIFQLVFSSLLELEAGFNTSGVDMS